MKPKYLTIDEVAILYSVPKSWIYERTRNDTIPFNKFGKYLRFEVNELDLWFKNNCSLKSRIAKNEGHRKE